MSALPLQNSHWSVFGAIARYWRRDAGAGTEPFEMKRRAPEPVLSTTELCALSSPGIYVSNLLERRMAALDLDPEELVRSEPVLLRGFQSLCASCQSPVQCAHDLAREFARDPAEPASTDWRDYCPNGTRLNMLSTLKSCSPR